MRSPTHAEISSPHASQTSAPIHTMPAPIAIVANTGLAVTRNASVAALKAVPATSAT
jgi:hypothetical protein